MNTVHMRHGATFVKKAYGFISGDVMVGDVDVARNE